MKIKTTGGVLIARQKKCQQLRLRLVVLYRPRLLQVPHRQIGCLSRSHAGKCDLSRAIRNHGIALRDATRRAERDLGPARSRTISRRPRESRARAAPSGVRLQPLHGDERERARKGGRERRARPTRPRARASRRPRGAARRSEGARDRIDRTMLRRSSSPQRGPGEVLRRRVRRDRVRKGARASPDRRGVRGLRAFAFTTARQ